MLKERAAGMWGRLADCAPTSLSPHLESRIPPTPPSHGTSIAAAAVVAIATVPIECQPVEAERLGEALG